ncbi:MAG: sigma-70 family RNA polymerase sigma factor [Ruminococcaceae bacterium]|nr:sigma-70 family RNA polymerase sigma factor [Oscillospiraceae bacterium]
MENTRYNDIRLPSHIQKRRMLAVIERELTELQRHLLMAVYFEGKSQVQLAKERGVCRSTICRTLHRAEDRLQRFLRY